MKVLNFFSGKKEGAELSNFWKGAIELDGRFYNCGESAFHGAKYFEIAKKSEGERKENLEIYAKKFEVDGEFSLLKGNEIKTRGGKGKKGFKLSEEELSVWSKCCVEIQEKICKYKYDNDEGVRNVLEKHKNDILIHPALRCSEKNVEKKLWEGRAVVKDDEIVILGGNMLGKIWMKIRDEEN